MSYQTLTFTITNHIAYVSLNRPDKLNSLTYQSFVEIDQVIKRIKKNRDLRAVIIDGKGSDFCTGLDVKGISRHPIQMLKLLFKWLPGNANLAQRVVLGWQRLPIPVIAKYTGVVTAVVHN